MRDADKMIQRLLAGLQDAEPSAGLERRILEAMDAHESIALGLRWRYGISPWLLRPSASISLGFALLLAAFLAVHGHRHAPPESRQLTMPKVMAQKAPLVPQPPSLVPVRHQRRKVAPAGETQTAGYPAPPLPLTEQEKLLLRLAHRGDAANIATLNRDVQAAQSAKATEQFQQFFGIDAKEMRNEIE
jgi:hypothetical protein